MNINLTYGLAYSLKNINSEVQKIFEAIDNQVGMGIKSNSKVLKRAATHKHELNIEAYKRNMIQIVNSSGLDITLRKSNDDDDSGK